MVWIWGKGAIYTGELDENESGGQAAAIAVPHPTDAGESSRDFQVKISLSLTVHSSMLIEHQVPCGP